MAMCQGEEPGMKNKDNKEKLGLAGFAQADDFSRAGLIRSTVPYILFAGGKCPRPAES